MELVNKITHIDWIKGMRNLADKSVHCIVTSPPYWALRDYKVESINFPKIKYSLFGMTITVPAWNGCMGLEPTTEMFVAHIVYGFREAKRVLRDDGTLWVNFGDSYGTSSRNRTEDMAVKSSTLLGGKETNKQSLIQQSKLVSGIKSKDLVGIPWMIAFALRDDGWYLRQDIIWAKPNPMPESVTDRCTKAHEYIFLLSKSAKYYYNSDAIKTDCINPEDDVRRINSQTDTNKSMPDKIKNVLRPVKSGNLIRKKGSDRGCPENSTSNVCGSVPWEGVKANKRSVWTVNTKPYKEAHFATFPELLIVDCIKAGCPENGIVLDPFMGAGTTAVVAKKLGMNYIGFELNPEYVAIANKRLYNQIGMFLD